MRRVGLIFSICSVLTAFNGCGHKGSGSVIDSGPAHLTMGLHAFDDCGSALAYFQSEATVAMETQLQAQKRWGSYCVYDAVPETGAAPVATPSASSSVPNHSTTNNQVVGVDEADVLKTFTVGGALYNAYIAQPSWATNPNGSLVVSRIYPVANAAVVGRIQLPGFPQGMLVSYPYAVVMSLAVTSGVTTDGYATKMTVLDIHDVTHPTVVRERTVEGTYVSARMVGQSVRVVTNATNLGPTLQWSPTLPAINACNPNDAERALIAQAYDALIAQNKVTIAKSTLQDWLPKQSDAYDGAAPTAATAMACEQFRRPGDPSGTAITRVTTFSLQSDTTVRAAWDDVGVVAEGQTVYASTTSLYIATNPYGAAYWAAYDTLWQQAQSPNASVDWVDFPVEQTSVHRFDMSDPTHTSYVSSNAVQGSLVNQFAMDEQNQLLRVASTTRRLAVLEQTAKSNNLVTVLRADASGLAAVGTLADIEVGEHITAVRFVGSQVFMSTMHETDPFVVVDLSNPATPTLRGTLPVPGDATYLQSLDANHVLAIGYGSAGTRGGWVAGVQLSIYDVSQPGSPKLAQNTTLAGDYVYSQALYDHLALTYFTTQVNGQPVNLLAFPVFVYGSDQFCDNYDCFEDGLRVYKVDFTSGFTYLGDVYHNSLVNQNTWGYEAVQRSVIMGPTDDGKTYVVSASDAGEKITDLTAFVGQPAEVASVGSLPY